jgi:hypothetical protein
MKRIQPLWQLKREISRECNDIIGSAKNIEAKWGRGKGQKYFFWLTWRGNNSHCLHDRLLKVHSCQTNTKLKTPDKSARQGNLQHPTRGCRRYTVNFLFKKRGGGSWHKLYSMHLPVKRTWFFCLALVQDKKISHRWK